MITEGKGKSFRKLSRTWYLGCCLLDAMKYGRWKDVYAIIKMRDLDPNVLIPEYGIAPMHCAAGIEPEEFGVKCIQEFLNIGGDPNVKCSEGVTPVHVASCWGRMKVLRSLLSGGGDPYLLDNEGNDAFYYAENKDCLTKLLADYENEKHFKNQNYNISNLSETKLTMFKTKSFNEDSEDLELNSDAVSLMVKHRQRVLIFEYFPEDDTPSTIELEPERKEDFTSNYNRRTKNSGVSKRNDVFDATSDVAPYETWTNDSDEICAEDILKVDKTRVIQVINDNVRKSLSASTVSEISIPEAKSISSNVKSEFRTVKSDNESFHTDLARSGSRKSRVLDLSNNESVFATEERNSQINSRVPRTDSSSINTLGIINISAVNDKNTSKTDCNSLNSKKNSSSSTLKSVSDESIYRSPVESKDIEKACRTSSFESSLPDKNNSKLPKNVRDKLRGFRVNTHYRSRTRVFRISRSVDGFKSKKSLYCSAFEFWSTKIRSKSYQTNTTRRIREK